jgi:hypothetical protein
MSYKYNKNTYIIVNMIKKTKSTFDEFIESLNPEERRKFDEEYRIFVLSELILAAIANDNVSVKKLAQIAKISPTIIETQKIKSIMIKNKHLGPDFDDILREEGTLEAAELTAIEMVVAEKTLDRKTFPRYLKERFNEDEIAEIKKQALQEYNALKLKRNEKNNRLRRKFTQSTARSRRSPCIS